MPNISLSWLRDHVRVPEDATLEEVAESLVSVGFEEEEIHPAKVTGPLVVGKVLSLATEEHSNGKTINYCRVDVGPFNDAPGTGKEKSDVPSRGIVCGAHNFKVGDKVAVALPGAVLPGPFPIAQRKTYGHVSDGMICSERELELGSDHDGIIVLNRSYPEFAALPEGADLVQPFGLGERVLEVNVTPDRGYGFAIRGLAREYSHATGAEFTDWGLEKNLASPLPKTSEKAFQVKVDADSPLKGRVACDRFVTQVVRGLDPQAATPSWMVDYLEQAGMRSISLPVDVTNYVMLDLGQPLHAYALESVAEPIVVRRARAEEKFTTLDGKERTLHTEDLLITDSPDKGEGSRIIGLAGVMGGLDSEVVEGTSDVVIEGAHFDPISVARTSRRHRLSSESAKRFERGVDFLVTPVAVQRTAELLAKYGGGQIDPIRFDLNATEALPKVRMSVMEPERLAGHPFTPSRIIEVLEEIGATVERDGEHLVVQPPSWRPDLTGPAHLVEEVTRIDGYDKIPYRLPSTSGSAQLTNDQWTKRRVSDTLAQSGLVEVLSYPFIGRAHDRQGISQADPRRNTLRLQNPLADDAPDLRTTILDSLLEVAERNASRGSATVAIFETGSVTVPEGTVPAPIVPVTARPSDEQIDSLNLGVPDQPWKVAAVCGGPQGDAGVLSPARNWDWADAISAAQLIGEAVGVKVQAVRAWQPEETARIPGPPVPEPTLDEDDVAPWHPGRVAKLFARQGKQLVELGLAGELHPHVVEEYGLPSRSAAFELDLDRLAQLVPQTPVQVQKVSVYPPAKIDLALIVKQSLPAADVERVLRQSVGERLESIKLFDVYVGDPVPDGHRSLAYALTLRAADHTLSPEEVTKIREKAIGDVSKRLGATLRA